MKKFLLIALLLTSVKGFAQVTLEHNYPVGTELYQVSSGQWNYAYWQNNSVYIYSINHSLIQTISAPLSGGATTADLWSLSIGLFTTDGEYVIGYYYYNTPNFTTNIIEEDGTSILQVDSAAGGNFYNTSAGTKLLTYGGTDHVYSLPGSFTGIPRPQDDVMSVNNAYPNPAMDVIHLPYTLAAGQQGELIITNMNGQVVKDYKVTSAFSDILINTGDLTKGSYLYYLSANGTNTEAKQFIVQ